MDKQRIKDMERENFQEKVIQYRKFRWIRKMLLRDKLIN